MARGAGITTFAGWAILPMPHIASQGIGKGIPPRLAEVEDVVDLVLLLLSDKSRHITIENIVIDGGATLGVR